MDAAAASTTAHVRPPARRLAGFYFAYYAALGAFSPYWGLFLKARGQDVASIGFLMGLWYATRIVAPSTWSWLAARSRQPIAWLRGGCALALASLALFLLPLGFAGLCAAMIVFCFAWNAVMPQFEALTLSHLGPRTEQYGRIRVWGSIGFVAVVTSYGFVFDHVDVSRLPWLMLPLFAALLASSFANRYGVLPTIAHDADDGFRARLRRPQVWVLFAVALLAQVSFGPYYAFFSIYLEQHGYRPSALGAYWTIGVLTEIAMFFASARVFSRFDPRTVVVVALASAALRWVATALAPENLLVMAFAQATHALNFAALFAGCIHFIALHFPGRMNGHAQGFYYGFCSGVGGVLGTWIAGALWHVDQGRTAFLVAAAIAAVAATAAALGLRGRAAPAD
jgi:PPP family 3-phenylpropionic acid transporter